MSMVIIMTPDQFCYWLQGHMELSTELPTAEQWKAINDHLQTVFHKVTPTYEPKPHNLFDSAKITPVDFPSTMFIC